MVSFPNFRFLYPSNQGDREEVFEKLLSGGIGNDLPAQRVLDLFLPGGRNGHSTRCQTVIIENEYVC